VYNSHVLYRCYALCIEITLTDANCTSDWVLHSQYGYVYESKRHLSASTLEECQKVCEFDHRCVAVSWNHLYRRCYIETDPNHRHDGYSWRIRHYDLVQHCNVTSGQCDESILFEFSSMNMVKKCLKPYTADYGGKYNKLTMCLNICENCQK